ncbi:hypothetical protein ABFS82_09G048000, partial [Erythranthe guttata]
NIIILLSLTVKYLDIAVNHINIIILFGFFVCLSYSRSNVIILLSIISNDILHLYIYLADGFKSPRELTWVTGVVLAVLTTSIGVTGYSLPRDQIGYWAVKIVTGVPDAIPVIGWPL